jgi:hypothetical protein
MKLTPEQIQGVLELEPNAQIDRLQGEKPYIRTGYWNRNRDLESLNAGLAKLGLKAEENDDYDEDTGWLYWYVLEPISNELSPEDQATVDKYEEEEANREVPRDYASMYEVEGEEELSPTEQMIQKLIDMASKGEFDNDQIRNLGYQLTSARKRYFTSQRSPESYKAAAEKAKQTKAQTKSDFETGNDAISLAKKKRFNSPLDVPIDSSNREKFKDEAEKIRRLRGQLPWNVSSSDRTPNPKYYDLVGTDEETGVKQYKLKGEWKGKVVTDYSNLDINSPTLKYDPATTTDDDIFINEARWAKLSGLNK